jgi:hypothetical protein
MLQTTQSVAMQKIQAEFGASTGIHSFKRIVVVQVEQKMW